VLKPITAANMDIYLSLAQLYEEEFAPITGATKDASGLFPLSTPIDETHIGYYYCVDNREIGFAVINTGQNPYDVCEFFVLKDYRKQGIGEELAVKVFNLHRVNWSVKQLYNAKKANSFWIKVISKYTGDNFSQHLFEDDKWGKVHMQKFSSKE